MENAESYKEIKSREDVIMFQHNEKDLLEKEKVQLIEEIQVHQLETKNLLKEKQQLGANGLDNIDFFNPTTAKMRSRIYEIEEKVQELYQMIENCNIALEEKNKKIEMVDCIISLLSNMQIVESDIGQDNISKEDINEKGIRILETYEFERKRIARDLHDSTVQNLVNIVHKLEFCSKIVDHDLIRTKLELATMVSSVKSTIDEMRNIIYNLRPMTIDDLGIILSVQQYIEQMKVVYTDIEMQLDVVGIDCKKNNIVNVTIFRIIQEACQNAFKYSKASIIIITIKFLEESINLTVEDDGIGFNMEEIRKTLPKEINSGFGLINMKERVELLKGKFYLNTKKNEGTLIEVSIPV